MKKTFLFLSLFVGLITTSFAQRTINDANAEKRTVGSFHGIEVATGIELTLTKGDNEEVAVSASFQDNSHQQLAALLKLT